MASIELHVDGAGAFGDVPKDKLFHTDLPIRIGGLEHQIDQLVGRPNPIVGIGVRVKNEAYGCKHEDGMILVQTTLSLLLDAADALKERYGDPRKRIVTSSPFGR